MIRQHNTHFHFRFSLVLFLVFLLTSPTQASSGVESCAAVALALNGVWNGIDVQFVRNLVHCVKGAIKEYSEIQGIIKQLPEQIDKVLPVARREGLALLSVYVLYKSYELYDEAMTLEANEREYRDQLDAIKKEWKPLRDLIVTELIPHVEKGNFADLEKNTDKLLQRMGRLLTAIQQLTQAIRQDIKTGGSIQRWSPFVATGGFVLCLGSLVVRPTSNVATPPSSVGDASFIMVSIPVCTVAFASAGYSLFGYSSVSDTLPKLEMLEKDATTMGQEITRYQSQLAKMRSEL